MSDVRKMEISFNKKIDTGYAESQFIKLLQEKKTFFLNGPWGSGKTEFITNVKNRAKKLDNRQKKKLILLDLWRHNNGSIFTTALRELAPVIFWVLRLFVVLILCCFIWFTGIVKIPNTLSFNIPAETKAFLLIFLVIISVGVSISKYLGLKLDLIDCFMLRKLPLAHKVLVVDDFDRLTSEQQENAYKLFTLLNKANHIPIVFLGDYQKLVRNVEENYLVKVIDQRIELPFVLHPVNIWKEYFSFLSQILNVNFSINMELLAIEEQRNLRDRVQFHSYVTQEFYQHNKKGRVDVENQLLVIYVYLFHEEIYRALQNGIPIDYLKDSHGDKIRDSVIKQVIEMEKETGDMYPIPFAKNRELYFIFEQVNNASVENLHSMLTDETLMIEEFEKSSSLPASDFARYVITNNSSFSINERDSLLRLSILHFKKHGSNSYLTKYFITNKSQKIFPLDRNSGEKTGNSVPSTEKTENEIYEIYFSSWSILLDEEKFDYSQKIRFFLKNDLIKLSFLANKYDEIDDALLKSSNFKYPEEMILIYLNANSLCFKFDDWNDSVWTAINQLNKKGFIRFCESQNILAKKQYTTVSLATETETEDIFKPRPNQVFLKKMRQKIDEFSIDIVDENLLHLD